MSHPFLSRGIPQYQDQSYVLQFVFCHMIVFVC